MATQANLPRSDRNLRKGLARKRRRRLLRRLRDLARLAMACCLAYGIYWLWASSVWQWQGQLRITGNRLVSKQEILKRISLPAGTPLYRLNPDKIAGQVADIPAIGRVAVRRWLFPARLEMTVLERQALVALDNGNGDLWLDQEGVVFQAPAAVMKPQFPIKVWSELKPGDRLPANLEASLFDLLSTWPRGQAGRIDLRQLNDVYANIDGWPVRLGEIKDIPTKLGMLQHLEPLAQKYKNKLEYIDLRFPVSPSFKLQTGDEVKPPKDDPAGIEKVDTSASAVPATPEASAAQPAKPAADKPSKAPTPDKR